MEWLMKSYLSLHAFTYFICCMNSPMQDTSNVPLCRAAERGHVDTVEVLLEGGANVNHQKKVRGILHHAQYKSLLPLQLPYSG